VNLTIELDRETDGGWIADIPELNILLYGFSKEDAIHRAEKAAREIIAGHSRGRAPGNWS